MEGRFWIGMILIIVLLLNEIKMIAATGSNSDTLLVMKESSNKLFAQKDSILNTVLYDSGINLFSFDGTTSTVIDLTTTVSSVQANNPRSYSFMIQTISSICNPVILSTGTYANLQTFSIWLTCGANPGIVAVDIDGGAYLPTSGKAINDGLWHTVFVTYDGTTISIYVDGRLDNTATQWNAGGITGSAITVNTVGNTGNFLGAYSDGNSNTWIGKLKNVLFYDYVVTLSYVLANGFQEAGVSIIDSGVISLTFDGTSIAVIPLSAQNCVQGNNPRSFSFMIQTTDPGGFVLSTGSATVSNQAFAIAFSSTGVIQVDINGDYFRPSSGKAVNDGLWHTVIVTYDGTTLSIYVDGIVDNTVTNWDGGLSLSSTINTIDNTANYLGASWDGSTSTWTGTLKNVQTYDYVVSIPYVLANSFQEAGASIYNTGNTVTIFDGTLPKVKDLTALLSCVQGNNPRAIVFMLQTISTSGFILSTGSASSNNAFAVGFSTSYGTSNIIQIDIDGHSYHPSTGKTINDGLWHAILVTYDGSKVYIYVDGISDNIGTRWTDGGVVGGLISSDLNTLGNSANFLGSSYDGSSNRWTGQLRNVGFYDYAGINIYNTGNSLFTFDGTVSTIVDLRTTLQCVQGNYPRSIAFMIKTTATGCGVIVSTGTDAIGVFGVSMSCGGTANYLQVYTSSGDFQPSTGKVINDGLWHTALVTYDGNGLKIYVDGKLASSDTTLSTNGINTVGNGGNYLGTKNDGSSTYAWVGELKNVQFYNYIVTLTYSLASSFQPAGTIIYDSGNSLFTFDGTVSTIVDLRTTLQCVQGNNPRAISFKIQTTIPSCTAGTASTYPVILSTGSFVSLKTFSVWLTCGGYVGVDIYSKSYLPTTGTAVNDGAWHDVLVSYDGTAVSIYIDGVSDYTTLLSNTGGSVAFSSNVNTASNTGNYLGAYSNGNSHMWVGNLKNVIFYDYHDPVLGTSITSNPSVAPSTNPSMSPSVTPTVLTNNAIPTAPPIEVPMEVIDSRSELVNNKKFNQWSCETGSCYYYPNNQNFMNKNMNDKTNKKRKALFDSTNITYHTERIRNHIYKTSVELDKFMETKLQVHQKKIHELRKYANEIVNNIYLHSELMKNLNSKYTKQVKENSKSSNK